LGLPLSARVGHVQTEQASHALSDRGCRDRASRRSCGLAPFLSLRYWKGTTMPKQYVSKAVGIDLGTTNSAVAVMNPADTDILIHKEGRRETTPSCVWKDPRSGDVIVGAKAFARIGHKPAPVRSIKRSMGRQTKVWLTNEEVTPEEISAHILREMKRQIEE